MQGADLPHLQSDFSVYALSPLVLLRNYAIHLVRAVFRIFTNTISSMLVNSRIRGNIVASEVWVLASGIWRVAASAKCPEAKGRI